MRKELKQLSTENILIQDCTTNGKACRQCNIKKSAIQSLLHRSYRICSSYQLIHKEFQHIKSCFLGNGYPDWFIDRQIKIFLNERYKNTPSKNKQERTTDIRRILLYMPYLGETSVQLEKELRNFFENIWKNLLNCLLFIEHTRSEIILSIRTNKRIWNDAMWYTNLNVLVVIPILVKHKGIWNFDWKNTTI